MLPSKCIIICDCIAADLRDDKQYLIDHPGATPIATAQASPLIKTAYRS